MKKVLIILCILFVFFSCQFYESDQQTEVEQDEGELTRGSSYEYNVYFGHLHNHSTYSDGDGTPDQAYKYARDTAGMDFFGLADHGLLISSTEWSNLKTTADSYNQDHVFVTFRGFEWSHENYGHVAVINSDDYCTATQSSTNTFSELLSWLNTRNCAAFLNHPGRQDDTGNEFNHFTNTPNEKIVGMELWNKSDDFDTYYYNNGYYSNDENLGYFDEANIRGWKIGAAGSEDHHNTSWGTTNDYRLGVLAQSKTRSSIYNALVNRRFFSTLDKNLRLYFDLNSEPMGSQIKGGTRYGMIELKDGDDENFTHVELIKNGQVHKEWWPWSNSPIIYFTVTCEMDDYFYVRVTQYDGDQAISSPIFVTTPPDPDYFSFMVRTSSSEEKNTFGQTRAGFISWVNYLASLGYRVNTVDTYLIDNEIRYFATYRPSTVGEIGIIEVDRNYLTERINTLGSQGWRVNTMSVIYKNGKDIYTAFFRRDTRDYEYGFGMTRQEFIDKTIALRDQNYRCRQMDTYVANNIVYYSALYYGDYTYGSIGRFGYGRANMINIINELKAEGWNVEVMSAYVINGTDYYSAFFRRSSEGQIGMFDIPRENLQKVLQDLYNKGYKVHAGTAYTR